MIVIVDHFAMFAHADDEDLEDFAGYLPQVTADRLHMLSHRLTAAGQETARFFKGGGC
jgi:hypothetical protein